jgi:hypothetical protein
MYNEREAAKPTITPGRIERRLRDGTAPSTCITTRLRTKSINKTCTFLYPPKLRDFLADSVRRPDTFKTSKITKASAPNQSARLGSKRPGRSRNPWIIRNTVTTIDNAECMPPHLKSAN